MIWFDKETYTPKKPNCRGRKHRNKIRVRATLCCYVYYWTVLIITVPSPSPRTLSIGQH